MSNRLYNQFSYSAERMPISLMGKFEQVGASGTRASLVHGDNTFTARAYGTAGGGISIEIIDPGADGSLSVVVVGKVITITLAYALGAITTDTGDLAVAIQSNVDANALITVAVAATSLVTPLVATDLGPGTDTVLSSNALRMSMTQIDVGLFKIQLEDEFPQLLSCQVSLLSSTPLDLIPQAVSEETAFGTSKSIVVRTMTMDTQVETDMSNGNALFVHLILRNSSN